MAHSMALTEYILHTRAPLNAYVRAWGIDPGNLLAGMVSGASLSDTLSGGPSTDTVSGGPLSNAGAVNPPSDYALESIRRKLELLFAPECRKVCANLRRDALLSNLDPWEEQKIISISIAEPYFPWERTFEISFAVQVSMEED